MQLAEFAKQAPSGPGVYFFKKGRTVLYVGKAININQRLLQYKNPQDRGAVILSMVKQADLVTWEETGSEIEAILRESVLIRSLKPKYNSVGKDDKSYSYLRINWSERWPRISLVREREVERGLESVNSKSKLKDEAIGPFVSLAMVSVLRVLRKIWPYRDCSNAKFASYHRLGRGCLYHQLGLCQAPCIEAVNENSYRQSIKQLKKFVLGQKASVLKDLEQEMRDLSQKGEYERAAVVRDRFIALSDLRSFAGRGILRNFEEPVVFDGPQFKVEAYDISNIQGDHAVGVLISALVPQIENIKGSEIKLSKDAYKKFRIKTVVGANDVAMLTEVLTRRFNRAKKGGASWALPDLIILDGGPAQLNAIRQLAKEMGVTVPIIAVAKGPTRKKVDLHVKLQDRARVMFDEQSLKQIALTLREEAHRYAISYYRLLHRKSLRSSTR